MARASETSLVLKLHVGIVEAITTMLLHEETAFSMSKTHFNANDEGTILQSNRNAKITMQYK